MKKQPNIKPAKKKNGRPLFNGQNEAEVVAKLEQAFALGCTDNEACYYAGLSRDALYDYQKKHPDFLHKKELLKEKPVLRARNIVVQALGNNDLDTAKWFLERKVKAEFSNRQELTGPGGKDLIPRTYDLSKLTTAELLTLKAMQNKMALEKNE